MGKFEAKNYAKYEELRQRQIWLTAWGSVVIAGGGLAALATLNPAMLAPTLASLNLIGDDLQGTSRRVLLMPELLEAFEVEDVEIEAALKPKGLSAIDFFLRFPDKEYILIQIRSVGNAKVVYNEKLEALQFRSKRGLKTWQPDPLSELARQEQWLRKEHPDLLGSSSRDRKRPLCKLLVLWGETTLRDHSEHLYVKMNDQNYLAIRKFGTANIVTMNQVVEFIRSYLASRRSPKTP